MSRIQLLRTGLIPLIALMLTANPLYADKDRGERDNDDRYGHMRGYSGMGMGGHYGGGMGMMGGGSMGMMHGRIQMLNLSDSQRKKINAIDDASRKSSWQVMGKMMDERSKLRDLYAESRLNVAKITASYDRIFAMKKTMIKSHLVARNQQYDLLDDKQRKELKELRGSRGYGYGGGHHRSGGMMGR